MLCRNGHPVLGILDSAITKIARLDCFTPSCAKHPRVDHRCQFNAEFDR
jgi:hypothetical protein